MILSRSPPPARRAVWGRPGLVARSRSGSRWAWTATPPEAMPSSWLHNLRRNPPSGCSPAVGGVADMRGRRLPSNHPDHRIRISKTAPSSKSRSRKSIDQPAGSPCAHSRSSTCGRGDPGVDSRGITRPHGLKARNQLKSRPCTVAPPRSSGRSWPPHSASELPAVVRGDLTSSPPAPPPCADRASPSGRPSCRRSLSCASCGAHRGSLRAVFSPGAEPLPRRLPPPARRRPIA